MMMGDWLEEVFEKRFLRFRREEYESENPFLLYLASFSGELPACSSCDEPTDEECGVCADCQYRDMHSYY